MTPTSSSSANVWSPAVTPVVAPVVVETPPRPEKPKPPARPALPPLRPLPKVDVWGIPFDRVDMNQTLDRIEALVERRTPSTVLTANLNFCMLHEDQPALQQITRTADLVIADGQPIVWRSRLSETPLPERVAGSELVVHLARLAAFRRWRIYLLGGQAGVPEQAAKALLQDNPSLEIVGTESPPFRDLTDQEQAEQIARIRAAKPDLLLVAFGQPKGDYWIDRNRQALGVPVCIQVGASLDFLAGTSQRAPLWVQVIGMEWAHRMMGDPRRLVPRYAANALFAAKKLTQDWREQVTRWGLGNWTQQPSG